MRQDSGLTLFAACVGFDSASVLAIASGVETWRSICFECGVQCNAEFRIKSAVLPRQA
jgi:anaerobic selenocysteine-containing dehydrogenase